MIKDKSGLLPVLVVGGGLAGSEAAWQLARRGVPVELAEMRPHRTTEVHTSGQLAELVCSNSLRSNSVNKAVGLLKEEMRKLGSLVISIADRTQVPAGSALAVDRELFSSEMTKAVEDAPALEIHRREVSNIPAEGRIAILATGPLTSPSLADSLSKFSGSDYLYFYDAISPVVQADSIDRGVVFEGSRYDKGDEAYLNCPMTREQYENFYTALREAELAPRHDFDTVPFFEACLPIEEMARRGFETLAFGPMKPVGLVDPRTGTRPFAVVQLRRDNLAADQYGLVGFQNSLRYDEQKRVLRMIPGLEKATFVRLGQIHRNTYINAPTLLKPTFQLRERESLFVAGQLSGVEGYVESAASGLLAGIHAARLMQGLPPEAPPPTTALGAISRYVSRADPKRYQPTNVTFGILDPLPVVVRGKRKRYEQLAARALEHIEVWNSSVATTPGWNVADA